MIKLSDLKDEKVMIGFTLYRMGDITIYEDGILGARQITETDAHNGDLQIKIKLINVENEMDEKLLSGI